MTARTEPSKTVPPSPTWFERFLERHPLLWRRLLGAGGLLAGLAALAAPLFAGPTTSFLLGLLMVSAGAAQALLVVAAPGPVPGKAAFVPAATSALAGVLLLAAPNFVFAGLAMLLGLSWVVDGVVKVAAAFREASPGRRRRRPSGGPRWAVLDGLMNAALGVTIAAQWPVSGAWSIALMVGLRLTSAGWSALAGDPKADAPESDAGAEAAADCHPDPRLGLGLPSHPEFARLRESSLAEIAARQRVDRYWRLMFVLTFFTIHVGRMGAEWSFVGLISPAVAVVGDVAISLLLAYLLVAPVSSVWYWATRPLERRAWRRHFARLERGEPPGVTDRLAHWWARRRMRYALDALGARGSATAAVGWGLHYGLPAAAVLIALNPVWGFSWYFNTENWATIAWERWAERRVDAWRGHMASAVRDAYRGRGIPDADFYRVTPDGIDGTGDFSFLVIGDPGEGDASQHVLRDQYLRLGARDDVKFLVVSSDVIYPSGAMKDYEPKFYLPFKGFPKPVYAVPGNHDWYDALEAFTANFLEPDAAAAALRGRREGDRRLTTTTEGRIDAMVRQAGWLRDQYGVRAAGQRAPFFEVQTDGFALIAIDTGILRTIDPGQMQWLRGALDRSRGKFTMTILGHPFYAAGRYHAGDDSPGARAESDLESDQPANETFAQLHQLLRDHAVDVVMAGDTHSFEHYREAYRAADGTDRTMLHFVNGGGGAYLSIGTPLDWPDSPVTPDWAFYPRTDALTAKLDAQTPLWKQPVWQWVKRLNAWPSSPEAVASAFDFNRAPFFQSFMEVRVERSAETVRLLLHGANGPPRWRDLQAGGAVFPAGGNLRDPVEFRLPLARRP